MDLIVYSNYLFWQCNNYLIAKTSFSQFNYSEGVITFTELYLETKEISCHYAN